MTNSLEERLKTHSSAFDGLLSLIPAKYYYDSATQDQWQQKKKSKAELNQHKRAKLNPESKEVADEYDNSHVSAKEVMDLLAKNAKPVELPKKLPAVIYEDSDDGKEDDEVEIPDMDVSGSEDDSSEDLIGTKGLIFDDDGNEVEDGAQYEKQKVQQQQQQQQSQSKNKKKKKELSPEEKKQRDEKLAKLRDQLASKITNLREKRKAVGTKVNGAPQSREQILAERKRKEELRKEKRKHAELEEEDEEESDSDNSDGEDDEQETKADVLFGNIVFQDGSQVTSDLTKLRNTAEKKKQKGPANNDIKAHLNKIEKKKEKLAQLSTEEQAKIQEKEKWQRMMLQAEGIKVKDDEKLLKKALKRKEKKKLKSEIEWKDRKQVVKDTVAARAKRREENLKARREQKGKKAKKGKQPKLRKFTGIVNKKKRAGFEGSAKSKGKK